MAGYNRIILMGNLAQEPELRYTPQGTAVADLRLAVTTVRGGRGNDRKEDTLFIDVTMWDRKAEVCCEYLAKGRALLVEGRLVEDAWEDRETGQKRSKMKVFCENFQFVGSRGDGDGGGGSGRGGRGGPPPRRQQQQPDRDVPLENDDFGGGDDIPF